MCVPPHNNTAKCSTCHSIFVHVSVPLVYNCVTVCKLYFAQLSAALLALTFRNWSTEPVKGHAEKCFLSHAHEMLSCCNEMLTRSHEIASPAHKINFFLCMSLREPAKGHGEKIYFLSRVHEVASRGNDEIASRYHKIASRGIAMLPRDVSRSREMLSRAHEINFLLCMSLRMLRTGPPTHSVG